MTPDDPRFPDLDQLAPDTERYRRSRERWLSRRKFLRRAAGITVAAGAGVLVDTFWIEPHWLELVRRDLPIAGLPSDWEGKLLVQISDIHIGPRVSEEYVLRSFREIERLAPAVVAYTGDWVSLHPDGFHPQQVDRVYRHLPRGSIATLGILGNHDYGRTWKQPEVADALTEQLRGFGVHMLRNQTADLDGLQVIGMEDLWAKQCRVAEALSTSNPDAARLVLSHNPDSADRPGWDGYRGWILSGHTHGGQCKPPFLPPPMVPVENPRYVAGEVDLHDGRRLYISRGLGHLLPVRFNVRPEITLFRLRSA